MRLNFEATIRFELDVSNNDTLQEIKHNIQRKYGFPISSQTLFINGYIIANDADLRSAAISDGSQIFLHIAAENPPEIQLNNPPTVKDSAILHQIGSPPSPLQSKLQDSVQLPTAAGSSTHPPPTQCPSQMSAAGSSSQPSPAAGPSAQPLTAKAPTQPPSPGISLQINDEFKATALPKKSSSTKSSSQPPPPQPNRRQTMPSNNKNAELNAIEARRASSLTASSSQPAPTPNRGQTTSFRMPFNYKNAEFNATALRKASLSSTASSSRPPPPLPNQGKTTSFKMPFNNKNAEFNAIKARKAASSSQPAPPPPPPHRGKTISVRLKYGDHLLPTELQVNDAQKASQLRSTMQDATTLTIPDSYIFIHKNKFIKENRTFASQKIHDRAVIEISPPLNSNDETEFREQIIKNLTSLMNTFGLLQLPDHQLLQNLHEDVDNDIDSFIDQTLAIPTATPAPLGPPSGEDDNMSVVVKHGGEMITVEVGAAQKVDRLRVKLEKMTNIKLPKRYSFLHKDNVMNGEFSFREQNVVHGDVIEIVS